MTDAEYEHLYLTANMHGPHRPGYEKEVAATLRVLKAARTELAMYMPTHRHTGDAGWKIAVRKHRAAYREHGYWLSRQAEHDNRLWEVMARAQLAGLEARDA